MKRVVCLLVVMSFINMFTTSFAEEWYEAEESSSTEYARSISTCIAPEVAEAENTPRYQKNELAAMIVEKDVSVACLAPSPALALDQSPLVQRADDITENDANPVITNRENDAQPAIVNTRGMAQ